MFNIGGNALLMFVFKLGVSGAAISTLVSRVFCMIVIFIALSKPKLDIVVKDYAAIRQISDLLSRYLQ